MFQFAYRNTYLLDGKLSNIRLPILFHASHRIAINAKLIAGLGDDVRFLGSMHQLLFIDGLGDVKGDSFSLAPHFQLVIPSTEFDFRLVFQPAKKAFKLEISIWVDTELLPVAASGTGQQIDYSPLFTQIVSSLAAMASEQNALTTQVSTLKAGQANITSALANLQSTDVALIGRVADILAILTPPTPTPTPTPTPDPTPTAAGVVWTCDQNDQYGVAGSYSNLNDNDGTTGTSAASSGSNWIAAIFPSVVRVSAIRIGAGYLANTYLSTTLNGSVIQGSTDNATWTDLLTMQGLADTGANQFVSFPLSNPVNVRYVRVYRANGRIGLTEFNIS